MVNPALMAPLVARQVQVAARSWRSLQLMKLFYTVRLVSCRHSDPLQFDPNIY